MRTIVKMNAVTSGETPEVKSTSCLGDALLVAFQRNKAFGLFMEFISGPDTFTCVAVWLLPSSGFTISRCRLWCAVGVGRSARPYLRRTLLAGSPGEGLKASIEADRTQSVRSIPGVQSRIRDLLAPTALRLCSRIRPTATYGSQSAQLEAGFSNFSIHRLTYQTHSSVPSY